MAPCVRGEGTLHFEPLHLLASHKHLSQTKEAMIEKGGGAHLEGFVLGQDCALGGWHRSVSCRDILRSNLAGRTVWLWESSPKKRGCTHRW